MGITSQLRTAIKLNMQKNILWVSTLISTGQIQTTHCVASSGLVISIRAQIDHLEMLNTQMKTALTGDLDSSKAMQKYMHATLAAGNFFRAMGYIAPMCLWLVLSCSAAKTTL